MTFLELAKQIDESTTELAKVQAVVTETKAKLTTQLEELRIAQQRVSTLHTQMRQALSGEPTDKEPGSNEPAPSIKQIIIEGNRIRDRRGL